MIRRRGLNICLSLLQRGNERTPPTLFIICSLNVCVERVLCVRARVYTCVSLPRNSQLFAVAF